MNLVLKIQEDGIKRITWSQKEFIKKDEIESITLKEGGYFGDNRWGNFISDPTYVYIFKLKSGRSFDHPCGTNLIGLAWINRAVNFYNTLVQFNYPKIQGLTKEDLVKTKKREKLIWLFGTALIILSVLYVLYFSSK